MPPAMYREVTARDDEASRLLMSVPGWAHIEVVPDDASAWGFPAHLHVGEAEEMHIDSAYPPAIRCPQSSRL